MDTLLELKFELNEEERRRYWMRYATSQARMGTIHYLGGIGVFLGMGILLAVIDGLGWLFLLGFGALVTLVVMRIWPSTEERALRNVERSGGARFALRYIQSVEMDDTGITSRRRALLGRQRLAWSSVDEAIRARGCLYVRDGGTQFVIPHRAFPSAGALADFEALVKDKIPSTAWHEPST